MSLDWMWSSGFRAGLELVYFASGAVVAVASVLVLRQVTVARETLHTLKEQLRIASDAITVAQEDIRVRSQREAVALAAERCERFADTVIPRVVTNFKAIQATGVRLQRWSVDGVGFDDPAYLQRPDVRAWLDSIEKAPACVGNMSAVLNDCEAFAVYFARGAAEEEVAYPVVGAVFCEWIEILAPHLVAMRTKKVNGITSGSFQNTITIFELWFARTKRKALELEANKINLTLAGLTIPEIRPIGTK